MKTGNSSTFKQAIKSRPFSASSKSSRDIYKAVCSKLKVPMCPAMLESLSSDEIEINIDSLSPEQINSLPRVLKYFRLKGLKLWSTSYEIEEFSKFGMRKGRGRGDEAKPSESVPLISSIFSSFVESVEASKRLSVFALFGLKLPVKTWVKVGGCLEKSLVSKLVLSNCEITEKELETVFQSIGQMSKLNVLDLSHNKISDGYLVSRIVSRQGERRDVCKWEGGLRKSITDERAETPVGLSELYLNDNKLTDKGWEKMLSCLENDNWLRLIDCKRNSITGASVKGTLTMLKENRSLLVVDLRFNSGFERGFLKVMEMVDRNFDFMEKGEENDYFTGLFEVIVNEGEFPLVCEVRFLRNIRQKTKKKVTK